MERRPLGRRFLVRGDDLASRPVDALEAHAVARLRADNPGPFTLSGTNTWIVGSEPAYVIDPGPLLDAHLDAIVAETDRRGGIAGIALTHSHPDHAEAVQALRARTFTPALAAANPEADVALSDGDRFGPLTTVATPGHSPDHVAFAYESVCFTGDAVLGEGSVFVADYPSALRGYLEGLRRLRALRPTVLCPGHGPPVHDPAAKIDGYLAHRAERERRLVAALERGLRTEQELLDAAWDDAPPELRAAAALTLRAHLGKLREEGRLPADLG
jgi:glyoxylase-like metal-dependent hydrolase (beta-lactamase superfamily II)